MFIPALFILFNLFFHDDKDLEEDGTESNRLKSDEERKYGKIPARIYLLYLRACGMVTLVVFFMSTLLWQAPASMTFLQITKISSNAKALNNLPILGENFVCCSVISFNWFNNKTRLACTFSKHHLLKLFMLVE